LQRQAQANRTRGFTLVEALVALIVLAVGMLGVASLFMIMLRSGASSSSTLQAISLATDIADRIRANRVAGAAYQVNGVAADNICVGAGAVNCTPAQMAANDTYLWQRQITQTWPGGAATGTIVYVTGPPPAPATYTITLSWVENTKGGAQPFTYSLNIQVPET